MTRYYYNFTITCISIAILAGSMLFTPSTGNATSYTCTGEYNCQSIPDVPRATPDVKTGGDNRIFGISAITALLGNNKTTSWEICEARLDVCVSHKECRAVGGYITGASGCLPGFVCCRDLEEFYKRDLIKEVDNLTK